MKQLRADKSGNHRNEFNRNKSRILKTQNTCAICGHIVDKNIKYPDPMSPVIDHIVPIAKGGHPSSLENLQLAHNTCNGMKSDKLFNQEKKEPKIIGNRNLPQSVKWHLYKPKD